MLTLVEAAVEAYLAGRAAHDDPVLTAMERQAAEEDFPIVGPQVGRLLMVLAGALGARRVAELGSGFGYSALWFAKALPDDGQVWLTDTSAARLKQAAGYARRAGSAGKIRMRRGDALALIRRMEGPFDIIFLDADKARYAEALEAALPKLRPGGLFIADNVLWSGKVASPDPNDDDTRGILAFTDRLLAHPHLKTAIVPVRDGVSISLNLQPR
ncbi:MAG TPA: O-methyltransferase [bacterium]